jgi:hypothetical protein
VTTDEFAFVSGEFPESKPAKPLGTVVKVGFLLGPNVNNLSGKVYGLPS